MSEEQSRSTPCEELTKLRQDLVKQKSLKEMFINREKETRSELETLQKLCSLQSLEQKVRETIRLQQKKLLQVDYEELQEAFLLSQDRFQTELQLQRASGGTVHTDFPHSTSSVQSSMNKR
ncbi:uncharacterized protein V6R79_016648 [Siganus canaliculatus]